MGAKEDELYNILLESSEEVSGFLKSVSHPGRVLILSLMMKGDQKLSHLGEATGLSKNALVNHLGMLIDKRLVRKTGRGRYALTADGEDLMASVASVYRDSTLREEARREMVRRSYTEGWREKGMSEKVIGEPAKYQPCWISYTGAIAGALTALGLECDITDVGGYSGYAFITNVIRGTFCPSGPTAFHPKTWEEMHKGTEDIGYEILCDDVAGGYPLKEGEPTPEDIARAKKLFEKVKREIDADRPAILWGLPIPEYGIVNGYRGNSYITSTYRSLMEPGKPEEPVLYYELQAPGNMHAIFFKEPIEVVTEEAQRRALERALRFAQGKIPVNERYATGPEAYSEWADALENAPLAKASYQGNSYVAACLWEAREMAAEFLLRTASSYPGPRLEHLSEASKSYAEAARQLKEFTGIFPFSLEGAMPREKRLRGAEILKRVKDTEDVAIEHLRKALENW